MLIYQSNNGGKFQFLEHQLEKSEGAQLDNSSNKEPISARKEEDKNAI
jgi:hypothetical protein